MDGRTYRLTRVGVRDDLKSLCCPDSEVVEAKTEVGNEKACPV